MRIVSARELENWLASGKTLEKDARGPKVVALPDGRFLKIFHSRRNRLQAWLRPAARRFRTNTQRLKGLGIAAPEVLEVFWLDRPRGLSACLYRPLPGKSLEDILHNDMATLESELPALANFIIELHHHGIYFRSLHLGNILRIAPEHFGLIDVLDLHFRQRPLGKWHISRNFQHLRNYLGRRRLDQFPLGKLIDLYQERTR